MRERATKIEQLTEQLKTYEELHNAQNEDHSTNQQGSSSSILPPEKRGAGGWRPQQQPAFPVAPNDEWYNLSLRNDFESSRGQQQSSSDPRERQIADSPRPTTRQRMECWTPTNPQRHVNGPLTPTPNLPVECAVRSDGMMPLNLGDFSATTYDNFTFDVAETTNKLAQSTSLLHFAVAGNHIDTIKVLLQDERVMIDDKDNEGFTPLQRAVMNGKTDIVTS
jgi:hypothetical protein